MKGGRTVLTRYMAEELSTRGIRVNFVASGSTRNWLLRWTEEGNALQNPLCSGTLTTYTARLDC
jgi:NAD(P)-dependent dehydrogenase (short-subunit alcohol dehydrogenase family)